MGLGDETETDLGSEGVVGSALILLLAASNGRGGGTPDGVIGRWAGERVAMIGNYAHLGDLRPEDHAECIYDLCSVESPRQLAEKYRKEAQSLRENCRDSALGDELDYFHGLADEFEAKASYIETAEPFTDITLAVMDAIGRDGWVHSTRLRAGSLTY